MTAHGTPPQLEVPPFLRGPSRPLVQLGRFGRLGLNPAPPNPAGLAPGMSNLLAGEASTAGPAWNALATQIQAEGGDLYEASLNFTNAWGTLASSGLNASQIATSVSSLVLNNSTLGGIATSMEGIVQGAISGNVPEIAQAIGGTLTAAAGAAIAAGSVSFGVGAIIVAGISLLELAVSSDLFGGSAPTATICGAQISGQAPTYAINCAWTYGSPDKRGPGSNGTVNATWRRFPEPSNANDAWWFTPLAISAQASFLNQPIPPQSQWQSILSGMSNVNAQHVSTTKWTSSASGPQDYWAATGPGTVRPIDLAWPQYHQLECDLAAASVVASLPETGGTTPPIMLGSQVLVPGVTYTGDDVVQAKFVLAYFGAWKVNQEYALNGIPAKMADDGDVLVHIVNLWSRARRPGATRTFTARNASDSSYQTDFLSYPQPCGGNFGDEWWYIEMLLPAIGDGNLGTHVALTATTSFQTASEPYALTVNTGALTAQPAPGTIVQGVAGGGQLIVGGNSGGVYTPGLPTSGASKASSSSSAGTVLLVLGGLAAVAAGGTYLYGRSHGMTFGQTVRSGWDHIRHPRGGSRRLSSRSRTRR